MNAIDTNRTHSSTLNAKGAAWAADYSIKGYASVKSGTRALANVLARIEADGLAGHFAWIALTDGKHAGRVVPSLGFEQGASVPSEAITFAHLGVLLISA